MKNICNSNEYLGEGLIFVGGAPRSGTTLVQRIFNAHPDIYGGPEFDMLPALIHQRNVMLEKVKCGRIDAFVNEEQVDEVFREMIRALLVPKRNREGATWISEKTPSNALVFLELLALFPKAKYVLCLRDPRSIVASMKEVLLKQKSRGENRSHFVRSVVASVDYINKCWSAGERAVAMAESSTIVYYEDLIDSPELSLRRVFDQLEIPFSSKVLDLEGSSYESPILNAKSDTAFYSQEQLRSGIRAGSVDKWKSSLGKCDVRYVEQSVRSSSPEVCQRYGFSKERAFLPHHWLNMKHSIADIGLLLNRLKLRLTNDQKK